jgi:hypothetical protein
MLTNDLDARLSAQTIYLHPSDKSDKS